MIKNTQYLHYFEEFFMLCLACLWDNHDGSGYEISSME